MMSDFDSLRKSLNFYSTQSVFSDPKEYAHLFEGLPDSISRLCKIIQGVIAHRDVTQELCNFKIPEHRQLEPNTRYISKILRIIIDLQDDKLAIAREPEKRFIGTCRDFSLLFCSILRCKKIPARVRCGFAVYFKCGDGWYVDHWLCEYWNAKKNRWTLVDAEVDDKVRREYVIDPSLNPLDVNHEQFILSGKAWQMCRAGEVDPKRFGVPEIGISGLWFVRGSLLRDLAALNKIELLPWDYTKFGDKQFDKLSELPMGEVSLIDELAEAVANVYDDWGQVRKLYEDSSQLQVHKKVTSYTSLGPKEVELKLD